MGNNLVPSTQALKVDSTLLAGALLTDTSQVDAGQAFEYPPGRQMAWVNQLTSWSMANVAPLFSFVATLMGLLRVRRIWCACLRSRRLIFEPCTKKHQLARTTPFLLD